jgi:hypothetical protein
MKIRSRFLNRRFFVVILAVLVVALIFAFAFTYSHFRSFYNIGFWQNSVSNFIATFLGLFFGVPVALWINDLQQDEIDRKEKLKSTDEARQRKKIILDSLRTELNSAYELFNDYPGYVPNNESFNWLYFHATVPCVEVWRSFSSSGELKWIDDVNLLKKLAWAYYSIQQVKEIGQTLIETSYIHPRRGGKTIANYVHKYFEENIGYLVREVKTAIDAIDEYSEF